MEGRGQLDSAVNHLGQLLQQVVLADVLVHVSLDQVVVGELADQLLEVVHGGGGEGAGGRRAGPPGL